LDAAAKARGGNDRTRAAFAEGKSANFILTVLSTWRSGQVLCPLEPGQPHPEVSGEIPADVVHLKTTSATTGAPRLVAFTAAQLMADAENIVATMGLRQDWPNLGVISLAHSYGFSSLVLPLLLHGIPLILAGGGLPEAVKQAAGAASALTLAAVPALWQTWLEARAIPPNVRLAISAGATLPLPLEQAVFANHGLKIHNFYGSTECGGIAFDSTLVPRADAALAGAPMCNVRVSVAEEGCLEVRGAAVGKCLWPEPGPSLQDGVFRTSDLGEISNGLIYIRGRASDQINIAGRKVLPDLIEQVLAQHPQVSGCVAFGVPSADPQRGEMIVACVAGGTGLTGDSLKQFALARLPAWQVPREWWLVDTLGINGRGKLSRAEWRKRFLDKAGQTE
jgi:acyl-CoA synthetase (AMP-forming)/AMP-acid ligase II